MDKVIVKQFTSNRRMGEVLGMNECKVQRTVKMLEALGLIVTKPHNKGTFYAITEKGRRYLAFDTDGFSDFSTILQLLKDARVWTILTIISTMEQQGVFEDEQ